ncbi:MAG TPA: DUF444 family protein [Isosphaeraceae bacterium]|nr:DUF444 family protein [Isosphaeraceae bacterium]
MQREAICFVIMSFSRNPLLEEIYSGGIKPAVEQLGFRCIRADELEHNERITNVVIDMICQADFIIADMTEDRPNCYYELGYAHALGKVVIPTIYREPTLHFEVQDYHFIVYSSAEDLRERLNRRIVHSVVALGHRASTAQQPQKSLPPTDPMEFAFLQYIQLDRKEIFELCLQPWSGDGHQAGRGGALSEITDASLPPTPLERRLLQTVLQGPAAALLYEPYGPAVSVLQIENTPAAKESPCAGQAAALAVFIMDVSGSMLEAQKEFAQRVHRLVTMWLEVKYSSALTSRYVIHDTIAHQCNEHDFFHIRESGGTKMSVAYELCQTLLNELPELENQEVYVIHFSDGDNWENDTQHALGCLQAMLLPRVRLYGYVQTDSPYGAGEYFEDLTEFGQNHPGIRAARAQNFDVHDLREVVRTLILEAGQSA